MYNEPNVETRQLTEVGCKATSGKFRMIASKVACWAGTQWAFLLALGTIILWVVSGPYFHFSDTWQLVINTSTTIITFLMVFLIQATQNRDSKAIHLKLDELIRAQNNARNTLIDLEHQSDEEIDKIEHAFSCMDKSTTAQ